MPKFMSNRNELDKYTNVLLIPSTLVFYVLGHTNYLLYQLRLFSMRQLLTKCLGCSFCQPRMQILKIFDSFFKRTHFYIHFCISETLFVSLSFFSVLASRYQQGIDDIFGKMLLRDQLRAWKLRNYEVRILFIS